jgi:hypothetical protein
MAARRLPVCARASAVSGRRCGARGGPQGASRCRRRTSAARLAPAHEPGPAAGAIPRLPARGTPPRLPLGALENSFRSLSTHGRPPNAINHGSACFPWDSRVSRRRRCKTTACSVHPARSAELEPRCWLPVGTPIALDALSPLPSVPVRSLPQHSRLRYPEAML